MNDFYYLSHGGPGSGRYPLGSGERPYQKFEGSGGRRRGISGYISARRDKKIAKISKKSKIDEARRKETEAEVKRRHDADKERVLREGTATDVLRYKGELTNQELQNAYTRLNLESSLASLSQKGIKSSMDKINSIMKNVKTGTEWIKIGTDAYNLIASIYNATDDGKKKLLPIVKKPG